MELIGFLTENSKLAIYSAIEKTLLSSISICESNFDSNDLQKLMLHCNNMQSINISTKLGTIINTELKVNTKLERLSTSNIQLSENFIQSFNNLNLTELFLSHLGNSFIKIALNNI